MDASGQIDWDMVRRAFLTGKWCIDWWEGDPRSDSYYPTEIGAAPYIRPRHSKSRPGTRDPAFGVSGDCLFLTDSGCSLEPVERSAGSTWARPMGCQMLKSKLEITEGEMEYHCDYPDSKQFKRKASIAWLPYRDRLFEVADEAEEQLARS
jgi:hypothetical protein